MVEDLTWTASVLSYFITSIGLLDYFSSCFLSGFSWAFLVKFAWEDFYFIIDSTFLGSAFKFYGCFEACWCWFCINIPYLGSGGLFYEIWRGVGVGIDPGETISSDDPQFPMKFKL